MNRFQPEFTTLQVEPKEGRHTFIVDTKGIPLGQTIPLIALPAGWSAKPICQPCYNGTIATIVLQVTRTPAQ